MNMTPPDLSLIANKVVLITGASSGIGEATARHLAARGAHLMLGARRLDRLEALASDLRAEGASVHVRALDVTRLEDMQRFADAATQAFGRIDVIINNAGVMPLSKLEALKIDEWMRMIDVNIRGVLHGIAAVLPVMQQQRSGQVINVASIGAHAVSPTAAVYCATKYAVWGDFRRLAARGRRRHSRHCHLAGRDHVRAGRFDFRPCRPR